MIGTGLYSHSFKKHISQSGNRFSLTKMDRISMEWTHRGFDDFVVRRSKTINLIRRGTIAFCCKVLSNGYQDIRVQNAMHPNGRIDDQLEQYQGS